MKPERSPVVENFRDRFDIVLVSPRNPLNIGAVARAMANFGFEKLTVVAPYAPHWREARSAVGAPELLRNATECATLAEALAQCSFAAGTGTLEYRKPEQPIVPLPELGQMLAAELERAGRIAMVFGPEKHGLTREDLSSCHVLVEIPTDPRQPSMNLGQAVAVCLYEVACRMPANGADKVVEEPRIGARTTSESLDRLGALIEETMTAAGYSPRAMQPANRHDLRLMLRRLSPSPLDTRRMLGLFRRILHRLNPRQPRRTDDAKTSVAPGGRDRQNE
jgi:TrmH family RNA methyltransferase